MSRRSGVIKTAPARRESAGVSTEKISTPGPRLLFVSKGAKATCRGKKKGMNVRVNSPDMTLAFEKP